jgi:branched-chain amino acid transport system permease protein
VLGVIVVTIVVEVLRAFEGGITLGKTMISLPPGSQEIGLGIVLALIMIFRPTGLTRGQEVQWPKRWSRKAAPSVEAATAPSLGE